MTVGSTNSGIERQQTVDRDCQYHGTKNHKLLDTAKGLRGQSSRVGTHGKDEGFRAHPMEENQGAGS